MVTKHLERAAALDDFYARHADDPLIVDKWLSVQAGSRLPGTLARVIELLSHPAFDIKVPNKVYSLIRVFAANHVRFHAADGSGYSFLADQVLTFFPEDAPAEPSANLRAMRVRDLLRMSAGHQTEAALFDGGPEKRNERLTRAFSGRGDSI